MKTFGYNKDYLLGLMASLLLMEDSKFGIMAIDEDIICTDSNYYLISDSIPGDKIALPDFGPNDFNKYLKAKEKNQAHACIIQIKHSDENIEYKLNISIGTEDEYIAEVVESLAKDIYDEYNIKSKKDLKEFIKMIEPKINKMNLLKNDMNTAYCENVLEKTSYVDMEDYNKYILDSIFKESLHER